MVMPELTRHSENLNALIAAHPDVTFYLYMVEGDSNNDFTAGENNGAFEYLSSRVNLPAEQMGRFAVDELETYERDFYQTDHHWCNVGSYRGYREAAALLGCTDLLEPLETVRVSDHFSGSKALSIGAQEQFFEPMDVYRFAFPQMSVTIAGEPADDYGRQDAALSGQLTDASYGGVYGWDNGEVILDTGTTGRGNLLCSANRMTTPSSNSWLRTLTGSTASICAAMSRTWESRFGWRSICASTGSRRCS